MRHRLSRNLLAGQSATLLALLGAVCAGTALAQTAPSAGAASQGEEGLQPVAAASPLPARLSDVEGTVRVSAQPFPVGAAEPRTTTPGQTPPPPPDTPAAPAALNMPVLAGTSVDTGEDGRAELQFDDGSVARLTPNSTVVLDVLHTGGEQLRVVRGLSYFELPSQALGAVTILVGPDEVRPLPGTLLRVDLDAAPYRVAVLRGSAHVNNAVSDLGFEVPAGQTATLDPHSPTAYDLKADLPSESWDNWNSDRDAMLADMAGEQTNARIGNGSPDAQAWNDLDYYGSWYSVPGQGMAWAPDGVDANFDPYGGGSWSYYPGVGPTWISAYPWGWLPYHCGAWNYYGGFGWGWQPGGVCGGFGAVGWYPYTGVYGAPRTYHFNRPPIFPVPRKHLTGVPIVPKVAPKVMPKAVAQNGVQGSRQVAVVRPTPYPFRQFGGARPTPRAFPLAAESTGSEAALAPMLPRLTTPYLGAHALPSYVLAPNMVHPLQNEHILGGRMLYSPSTGGVVSPRIVPVVPVPGLPSPPYAAPAPARLAPAPAPRVTVPAGRVR